jgi:phage terminase large subunit
VSEAVSFFSGLAKSLKGEVIRSRENLVPAAFAFLWEIKRYIVAYGGRASAKSWSIARVILILAFEQPHRVLCCREIQGSIKESAYRLFVDQIEMLGLTDFYEVQADTIIGKNGSRFYFEGLRYNTSRIRSYEGITIVWCEEAQSVSELSWETLLPTIRKAGSRFFISFNPLNPDDPVLRRFVNMTPPGTIARKVSFADNPYLSAESEAERQWLEQSDPDNYKHVWLGEPRTVSDALILRNKYFIESFDIDPSWAGPFHGVDFGFSKDPSAGVRCHIDDVNRALFISREFWQLGCDIDRLPEALEAAIPGISSYVAYCDSSRPETISYLSRNGVPNARAAEKWPGSVDDGVMYLRSFARIVIDPSCVHVIDECRSYSFKTDRLTGAPLPEAEDKHNHCIDALRYAIWPLIRNLPARGYFSRAAVLVGGEAIELPENRPEKIFGVLSTTDRSGSGVGFVCFAYSRFGWPLTVLHYDLVEMDVALEDDWLVEPFARMQELTVECRATHAVQLCVENDAFGRAVFNRALEHAQSTKEILNVYRLNDETLLPPSIDERARNTKALVNSGRFVKLSRMAYARQVTHRSSTTNHLASQLFGFRPEAPDTAQELVNAFCTGVLLAVDRRRT